MAEAATLAHVARPLVLSAALDPNTYNLAFACDPRCQWLLRDFPGRHFPLWSQGSDHFIDALSRGKPLYDEATLDRYVRDDLDLLDAFEPAVVIGDFRLSLSISARLRNIPYVSISNCYWSPYWRPPGYTVPNIRSLTGMLPLPIAKVLFQLGRPLAFALHCRPLNRVRRSYGLSSLGTDLRRIYTDADYVLYADIAELFPDAHLPANHQFIGPLLWSPPVALPDSWQQVSRDRPAVYVTLGSSGQAELLPAILRSLGRLPIVVMAATAGADMPADIPANAYIAKYLPGTEAASRARLVICNGGSPTSHQAVAAGAPVIGIAGNLDQFLNMGTLVHAGAGEILRADRFSESALTTLVSNVLDSPKHTAAARKIATAITGYDSGSRFAAIIRSAVPT